MANDKPQGQPLTFVKLEMTAKELEMMVYMLGAIDLRTEPETLKIAMALREKLSNAQKFLNKKPVRPKDKYGKPMTDEEIKKAQAIAQASNPSALNDDSVPNPEKQTGNTSESQRDSDAQESVGA
jgi:hypothetical protein